MSMAFDQIVSGDASGMAVIAPVTHDRLLEVARARGRAWLCREGLRSLSSTISRKAPCPRHRRKPGRPSCVEVMWLVEREDLFARWKLSLEESWEDEISKLSHDLTRSATLLMVMSLPANCSICCSCLVSTAPCERMGGRS